MIIISKYKLKNVISNYLRDILYTHEVYLMGY